MSAEPPLVLSLGEIELELRKAARGVGLDWGLAEDAGRAARVLAPSLGLEPLVELLDAHRAGSLALQVTFRDSTFRAVDDRPLSPLVLGPSLADHAHLLAAGGQFRCLEIRAPAVLLPYVAAVGLDVELALDGRTVRLSPFGLPAVMMALALVPHAAEIRLRALGPSLSAAAVPVPAPVLVPSDTWHRLTVLAALTYVPASLTSRLRGAGAGTRDED